MIEPVSARTTTQLQEVYERYAQHSPAGPSEISAGDQQRFEAALNRVSSPQGPERAAGVEETQVAQLQSNDPWVISPPAVHGVTGPAVPTIGERILDGMTNLREGMAETQRLYQEMRDNPVVDPVAALNLQMQMNQTSIMLQLTTSEVSTISQKIDGLLKTG
jgi:hypothetical protein